MKWLVCIFVAAIAGAVQTVSGFGSAIVLVLFFQNQFGMLVAPAIATSINLLLTISLTFKYRKHIEWDQVRIPAFLYVILNSVFILVAKRLNLLILKKFFGIFLILLAIYLIFFAKRTRVAKTKTNLVIFSILSSVTGGFFSIGGPMLSLYYSEASKSKESYIANMQFLFMLICITATATRVASHIYSAELLPVSLVGFVGVTIGKRIGIKIVERIEKPVMNIIIYVFIALSGLMLIV